MDPLLSKSRFLRPQRTNVVVELARYALAVLLAVGALYAGVMLRGTQRPLGLICTFAVLISALVGGHIAGWMTLAITGIGVWFVALNGSEVRSATLQPGLVLWCAYMGLGVVLVEVIRHLQSERERLLEHDQRLRLARRAARIWFWEWDLEKNVLRWSREGEPASSGNDEYHEVPLELYLNDRVHPEDRQRVLTALF